jgi:hypothetical protein
VESNAALISSTWVLVPVLSRIFLLISDLFLCFAKVLVLLATCIIRLDCSVTLSSFVLQHDHGTWNIKPSLTIGGGKYFGNEKKE